MSGRISKLLLVGMFALGSVVAQPGWADGRSKQAYWVERYHKLHSAETSLQSELGAARARHSRGRRANRLRGEERGELRKDIVRMEKELARVERDLAAFPEEARRAGALPGWFRDL